MTLSLKNPCAVLFAGILFSTSLFAVMTKEKQQAMTAADALNRLKQGNERFIEGRCTHRDYNKKVAVTAQGQYPFAAVVGCIDSRVPTELVFDQTIGDIFNARVAGPVLNDDILGSLEFATKVSGSRLVLVLGHTECGAVKGAIADVEMGHLTGLVGKIRPAIKDVPANIKPRNDQNKAFVNAVARKNVERIIAQIRAKSPILKGLEDSKQIDIVGAIYDVKTGKVEFFE